MEVEHLEILLDKCGGDVDVFLAKISDFMVKDSMKIIDLLFEVDKLRQAVKDLSK